MVQVSARELRHGLSEHLARVDAGELSKVTLRGRAIGQLGPSGRPTAMEELLAERRSDPR
jgi:antitoxin (DNA-binding transcriptional repressor) of toxin-antitoxin stability system